MLQAMAVPKAPRGDGTPPLRLVAWETTRRCNLACKHCRPWLKTTLTTMS